MEQPKYLVLAGVAAVSVMLGATFSYRGSVKLANQTSVPSPTNLAAATRTDLPHYSDVRTQLQNERTALLSRYQHTTVTSEKNAIINEGREIFVQALHDKIFPHWYGTEWDFYGTTEIPNQGKIACGYFVSTVLRDFGMKVQRARLAQQASENIILSLTTNEHVKRFRLVPINRFVDAVKNWGSGLYVVGLDNHVGFIVNLADDVYFIHSSYVDPYCVVKERALGSQILAASRYRVLGKLSEDDQLILKWLRGDQFPTRRA